MGIPDDYHSYAILPVGFPMGKFVPGRRAPLESGRVRGQMGTAVSRISRAGELRADPGDTIRNRLSGGRIPLAIRMRIFIATLATETNTFSPIPTGRVGFMGVDYYRRDASLHPPITATSL